MTDVRVGLAGVGYWGSKLARNIFQADGCELALICDPDSARAENQARLYGDASTTGDLGAFVADPKLDAVILATPASLHAEHARAALNAGKHVMVEKPLALTVDECEELCDLAERSGLVLMVGHTFIYSEPVRFLRQLVESGELGDLLYVYSQRVNLGVIREDLNALWNFGPHDISILLYLVGEVPISVSARQFPVLGRGLEDVAFVVLEFASGVVGHIHNSWLDPRKVRQVTVVGSRKMVVYDDTNVESPVRIFDKGVMPLPFEAGSEPYGEFKANQAEGFGEFKLQTRAGDILAPRIEPREPLRVEVDHFVDCVRRGKRPLTDGRQGRDVVAILEGADRSSRDGGAAISLEPARA
jgi:predicted dehydrogenase